MRSMSNLAQQTPQSTLNGPIGPHRRYAWTEVTVSQIKHVREHVGGTFNDVVLAAITGGFRELLLARGESVDRVVRTLVPVSVRPRDASGVAVGDGVQENQVSAMFADLPIELTDPVERLHAVSAAQMDGLKDSKQAMAGEALTSLTGFAPPLLLALGGRIMARAPQRSLNTVTTNVPGPQLPLYCRGRLMEKAYGYVPLAGQIRVGVAIFSYNGELTFGVTGDYDTTDDIEVLCQRHRAVDAGVARPGRCRRPSGGEGRRGTAAAGQAEGAHGDRGSVPGRGLRFEQAPGAGVVGLPRGRARHRVDQQQLAGQLVGGHVSLRGREHVVDADVGPVGAGGHAHDALAEALVGLAEHQAVVDARDGLDGFLDLLGEDLLAAGVDALRAAPEQLDASRRRRRGRSRRAPSSARRRRRGRCAADFSASL